MQLTFKKKQIINLSIHAKKITYNHSQLVSILKSLKYDLKKFKLEK